MSASAVSLTSSKSSTSTRFLAVRSRVVSGSRPQRHSIILRMEVCSYGPPCATRPGEKGETTTSRDPEAELAIIGHQPRRLAAGSCVVAGVVDRGGVGVVGDLRWGNV